MSDAHARDRSLESLKKEAKRWLAALRVNDPEARARFARAIQNPPNAPTLRDVQLALAREYGFDGWAELVRVVETRDAEARATGQAALARYETMADVLLDAYRTGTAEAMERLYRYTWHRRTWSAFRTYAQLDLGKRPTHEADDVDLSVDDARYLVAVEHGFPSWDALRSFTQSPRRERRLAAKPVRVRKPVEGEDPPVFESRDWDEIMDFLAGHPHLRLDAEGQMTDEILAELCRIDSLGAVDLAGSQGVTDAGVRHLRRLGGLKTLNLDGTAVTDDGLTILRDLPALELVGLHWTAISDRGARYLANCQQLERVDLGGTRTGDGALASLAGKPRLRELTTGTEVNDAGLRMLHEMPVFKTWQGGEPEFALTSYRSAPNYLTLRGRFTDNGIQHLRGMDGLFGLNLDDANLAITAAAMEPLVSLPNLGWLAVNAKDNWMPQIARMPKLRFLGAQDTATGDDGWVALSQSRSLEMIWGRRCHNLRTRGFHALSRIPKLRGLSVSCLNVDDEGVAALPEFPSLRELMPMDIPDTGYRHIGRCERLESLVLMYCRDTTDAATEHLTKLPGLSYYFNSYTTITDRTPELLSTMDSLERITFDACHGLTNSGVAKLERLPKLRELRVAGRGVTSEVSKAFTASVLVRSG
ncbi:MAG TPA: hypothetical protein VGH98_10035 [Gemmatimonadaceae bacterium]|jgi:hypothetical protein